MAAKIYATAIGLAPTQPNDFWDTELKNTQFPIRVQFKRDSSGVYAYAEQGKGLGRMGWLPQRFIYHKENRKQQAKGNGFI